jgi:predicted Holliday junction resolvase-like endonuclease
MDLSRLFTDTSVTIHIIVYALIPILAVVITILVFKNRRRKRLNISEKLQNDMRTREARDKMEQEEKARKAQENQKGSQQPPQT